jgi:hypothetical protein
MRGLKEGETEKEKRWMGSKFHHSGQKLVGQQALQRILFKKKMK